MKKSIRLMLAVLIVGASGIGAGSARAWDATAYPGQDAFMTDSSPLTTTVYSGGTPVMSFSSHLNIDVTLNPDADDTGTVDGATFTSTSSSTGLTMVVTPNNLPWSITEDPSGSGGVIIDVDYHVTVGAGVTIYGTLDNSGSVTGVYSGGSCQLTFTNATGISTYSATGVMAGLSGLPSKLSGTLVNTADPCVQLGEYQGPGGGGGGGGGCRASSSGSVPGKSRDAALAEPVGQEVRWLS